MNEKLTPEESKNLNNLIQKLGIDSHVPDQFRDAISEPVEICSQCGFEAHPCIPCEDIIQTFNHVDSEYARLLQLVLKDGRLKKNRTGIDTIGVFGAQAKYAVDMNAFPILTTKKVWFKGIVHELLWFIKGDTNIKYLVDNDVHIWDAWAYKQYDNACKKIDGNDETSGFTQEAFIHVLKTSSVNSDFVKNWGELGEGTYGGMWRAFPVDTLWKKSQLSALPTGATVKGKDAKTYQLFVDQLQKVIDKLKTNPDDRRMIVSAWHPYWVDQCALPPCHCLFHFNTEELTLEERWDLIEQYNWDPAGGRDKTGCHKTQFQKSDMKEEESCHAALDNIGVPRRRLNCLLYQRSCDTFIGVPFNITSYCLLLAMVAHCSNMAPGVFTHTYGDLHIYVNHMDQVKEQLNRAPMMLPKLWLNPKVKNIFDFKFEDIKLVDYKSHSAIKGDIAV